MGRSIQTVSTLLFLAVLFSTPVKATSTGSCTEFAEDFSGLSNNQWRAAGVGNWYFQDQQLHVSDLPASGLTYVQTDFAPSGPFTLDVEIERLASPSEGSGYCPAGYSQSAISDGEQRSSATAE